MVFWHVHCQNTYNAVVDEIFEVWWLNTELLCRSVGIQLLLSTIQYIAFNNEPFRSFFRHFVIILSN